MAVDPLLRGLLPGFLAEARGVCERATLALLDLERAQSDPVALAARQDEVARDLHTLKGSAATLGLDDVAALAHRLEEVLAPAKESRSSLPATAVDALLRGLDLVLQRVDAHAQGRSAELPPVSEVLASIGGDGTKAPASEPAPAQEDESWRVDAAQVLGLVHEVERLREVRLRLDERRRELERALARLGAVRSRGTVEERALLERTARLLEFDAEESGDVVRELEERLKAICTLPLRLTIEPLHRAVRDLCRREGKRARLSVVGDEVSLDRRLLNALRGPLVHLVRNAIDHGIEPPSVREAAGKSGEGLLTIRVEQHGNLLLLEVQDDGAGIDVEAVRAAARAREVETDATLSTMSDREVLQLVFRPGFSTRASATETSGRGVGLDVVLSQARALRGHVEVQTRSGQGTRFILTVPTELGCSAVFCVRVGEHQLGVPMASVERVTGARAANVSGEGGRARLSHDGQVVPLVDLAALLGLRGEGRAPEGQPVLLVSAQGRRVAVAVDEVLGHQELTVRPLPPELTLAAYLGAATLARGELLLVLRPDWLIEPRELAAAVRSTRRVLVVDDSLTARALHRAALEAGGLTVHAASGGRQALEQLRQATYDLVVCDVAMEGMDGLELVASIRRNAATRALPVILVSAKDSEADRERGLSAGANAFLSKKDCAAGRLLGAVEAALERRPGVTS